MPKTFKTVFGQCTMYFSSDLSNLVTESWKQMYYYHYFYFYFILLLKHEGAKRFDELHFTFTNVSNWIPIWNCLLKVSLTMQYFLNFNFYNLVVCVFLLKRTSMCINIILFIIKLCCCSLFFTSVWTLSYNIWSWRYRSII